MSSSRLIARLDAAIAEAKNPVKADCLRAERAGALARRGAFDEARQVLAALHMKYASNPNAVMSAWLCWGDGLLNYYNDLGLATTQDRMRRAYALSGAARDMQLHALAASWLALFEYGNDEFEAAAQHLSEALTLADADNHAARGRACLNVAQIFHYAGRADLAQPWYAKGRQHALAEGDESSIGALMHNMAWLQVSDMRQALAANRAIESPRLMMGVDSTHNFDTLAGLASLNALVPILRAQVLTIDGQWQAALDMFDAHMQSAMTQGLAPMQSKLRADMAWCHAQLARADHALQLAQQAERTLDQEVDRDDRAAAHSRLAQVFTLLDMPGQAERHASLAAPLWAEHAAEQARIAAILSQALDRIAPAAAAPTGH